MRKPWEQAWIFDPVNKVVWMRDGNGDAVDVDFSVPENGEFAAAAPDMARALMPLAHFVAALDAQPIRGIDDVLYSIHGGSSNPSVGAEIRLSDLRKTVAALRKAGVL